MIDSRVSTAGDVIRRRRECESCARRFTSRERVEDVLPVVVKKDGVREPFDREKVLRGVRLACNKRPVAMDRIERFIDELERELVESEAKEVASQEHRRARDEASCASSTRSRTCASRASTGASATSTSSARSSTGWPATRVTGEA